MHLAKHHLLSGLSCLTRSGKIVCRRRCWHLTWRASFLFSFLPMHVQCTFSLWNPLSFFSPFCWPWRWGNCCSFNKIPWWCFVTLELGRLAVVVVCHCVASSICATTQNLSSTQHVEPPFCVAAQINLCVLMSISSQRHGDRAVCRVFLLMDVPPVFEIFLRAPCTIM